MKIILVSALLAAFVICCVSESPLSSRRVRHYNDRIVHRRIEARNLDRRLRQAEDSYEDGGDYEYEEEGDGKTNDAEENAGEDVKTTYNEDYYENSEEERNGGNDREDQEESSVTEREPEPSVPEQTETKHEETETEHEEEQHQVETQEATHNLDSLAEDENPTTQSYDEAEEEEQHETSQENHENLNEVESHERGNDIQPVESINERTEQENGIDVEAHEVEEIETERQEERHDENYETEDPYANGNGEAEQVDEENREIEPVRENSYEETRTDRHHEENENENEIESQESHRSEHRPSVEIEDDGLEELDRYRTPTTTATHTEDNGDDESGRDDDSLHENRETDRERGEAEEEDYEQGTTKIDLTDRTDEEAVHETETTNGQELSNEHVEEEAEEEEEEHEQYIPSSTTTNRPETTQQPVVKNPEEEDEEEEEVETEDAYDDKQLSESRESQHYPTTTTSTTTTTTTHAPYVPEPTTADVDENDVHENEIDEHEGENGSVEEIEEQNVHHDIPEPTSKPKSEEEEDNEIHEENNNEEDNRVDEDVHVETTHETFIKETVVHTDEDEEREEDERERYEGRNNVQDYNERISQPRPTESQPHFEEPIHRDTNEDQNRIAQTERPAPADSLEETEEEEDEEEYYRPQPTTTTTTSTTTSTTTTTPAPTAIFKPSVYDSENDISDYEDHNRGRYNDRNRGRFPTTPEPISKEISAEEDFRHQLGAGGRDRDRYDDNSVDSLETEEDDKINIPAKIECTAGYELSYDESECVDVNECSLDFCGTSQICINLPGSYQCNCPPGFNKDLRNTKVCRDVNECENRNGGCQQDCINTLGSYFCSCADDSFLLEDSRSCMRTTTTSTTTTTTTTTTTPPPPPPPPPASTFTNVVLSPRPGPGAPQRIPERPSSVNNCPTPAVPRGAGIAYLYCSRSPVGIHHRHSQYERRLLQDWASKRNRTAIGNRNLGRFRHRRNLKRKLRQTTYSPGSMCELRCRSGFELKGLYSLHCNASDGTWQGVTTGQCQAAPRPTSPLSATPGKESAPSNEIPRLAPNVLPEVSPAVSSSSFDIRRPNYQYRPTLEPTTTSAPITLPTTTTTTTTTTPPPPPTTTYYPPPPPPVATRPAVHYPPPARPATVYTPNIWQKPQPAYRPFSPATTANQTTTPPTFALPAPPQRPYHNYSPSSNQYPYYKPPSTTTTTTTTPPPTTTTTLAPVTQSKNSFIQLTYRFKTPWIECPDDIKVDLPTQQSKAYVIIPQPQTNVDWWRQVSSDPTWAKGLETEMGPGKQLITFRARTPAPVNNTAECSFHLEVRDSESPRVRECPESFSTRLMPGQNAKAVTWIEPHFSDNVRIASLKKSHEPGTVMTGGEHLINYEARDTSENTARCSFTVTVLPPLDGGPRRPVNTEGLAQPATTSKPEYSSSSLRNVVCHVGKKGRRIMFQSRVVPRGCSEITVDVVGDSTGQEKFNTLNTVIQNSAENLATSQISSVSFSSHDTPHSASGFSQAISNGRNNNRLVHSTSSVTNGAHGTNSRASSYAVAISSSSRNFELPFLTQHPDKQVYDEDFVVPTNPPPNTRSGDRNYGRGSQSQHYPTNNYNSGSSNLQINDSTTQRAADTETRKYFRHFDSWDTDRTRNRANHNPY